jgi:hypothetical protein
LAALARSSPTTLRSIEAPPFLAGHAVPPGAEQDLRRFPQQVDRPSNNVQTSHQLQMALPNYAVDDLPVPPQPMFDRIESKAARWRVIQCVFDNLA